MSNCVEFVRYDEKRGLVRVNSELAIGGIDKKVWEHIENGYQVVMKYLVDRKKKDLTQKEINEFIELVRKVGIDIVRQYHSVSLINKEEECSVCRKKFSDSGGVDIFSKTYLCQKHFDEHIAKRFKTGHKLDTNSLEGEKLAESKNLPNADGT